MRNTPQPRSTRAKAALAHMPEVDPALASLALWCEMRDADGPLTYTSGDTVCVGNCFSRLSLQEQIGLLGRHILHVALRHERALSGMHRRVGAAFRGDLHVLCSTAIVNECLLRGGHALPRPAILLRDFMTEVLEEDGATSHNALMHLTADKLYLQLMAAGPKTQQRAESFGRDRTFEPDIFPDVPDPLADRGAPDWQAHLIRAYQAGGGSGRGIGSILRKARFTAPSRTPWEQRLRGLVAKAVCHQPRRSFRRPRATWIARDADAATRGVPRPVFEPAQLRQSFRPRIVVGVDTSGSVTPDILSRFGSEVIGVARKSGAETHVLCFDEEVYADFIIDAHQPHSAFDRLEFRQDGGTSFVDLMARAEALAPSIIVVLTDGAGQFGARPAARVIWATLKPLPAAPPFGTLLDLTQ